MTERPARVTEGLSATQHGARIGKSRSAVLGHEYRERQKANPSTPGPAPGTKSETDSWGSRVTEKFVPRPAPPQERKSRLSGAGLDEATDALTRALTGVLGIRPTGQLRRVAERTVQAYLTGYARVATGSRMKESTLELMGLNVGDTCEVEATCKQNLHCQLRTVRRKLENPEMKYRTSEIKPGLYLVERRQDGAWEKGKPPHKSVKGVWLSELPVGGPESIHPTARHPFDIINAHNKNKARAVLEDTNAEWKARTTLNGVAVKRIR